MIGYQCLRITRLAHNVAKTLLLQNNRNNLSKQIIRKSHDGEVYYRKHPPVKDSFGVLCVGTMVWWWVFWSLFTDYEELIGESYPDPSKWTDEELGIPPDDE